MPPHIMALLFDLGDTIMDEGTEIKDATGTTLAVELIPGMSEALHGFKAAGYRLAIVADSRPNTPPNVLRQHDLLDLFEYLAISEVVGASTLRLVDVDRPCGGTPLRPEFIRRASGVVSIDKPDARIFRAALDALGIPAGDYGRVVMVGNNLERDIAGANRLGLISVFFHWNERRRTQPLTADEIPCYTVTSAHELIARVARLESPEGPMQDITYRQG